MNGRNHALAAGTAFLAVSPLVDAGLRLLGHDGLDGGTTAAGTLLAAGAGMLPDLDHPSSTIARSLGFVTGLLARLVAWAARGHRWGTHCWVGIAAATALTAVLVAIGGPAYWAILWLLLGLAWRSIFRQNPRHLSFAALLTAVVTAVLATVLYAADVGPVVVPVAVAVGCLAHVACDWPTDAGIAWRYPWVKERTSLHWVDMRGRRDWLVKPFPLPVPVVLYVALFATLVTLYGDWHALALIARDLLA